ncbi:MAG TPA: lysylphosphatidylglycerol synthase transmembrane domain-containing protein [Gemmataceae bacterium]|nr:lysylphosphatidylglycerol synthase transmembrane domain-containing protein [Gemmataceae bacterium]
MHKKLRLGCSVALLAFLAWRTDWHQIAASFTHLRWGVWLLAVGVYVVTQVVSSLRWQWLARPLGFRQGLRRFVALYYVGMFFNLVLPTSVGGDVVRAWYLGGPGKRLPAFLSVFLERLSGLMVLLVIACGAAALCPLALPAWIPWSVWGLTAAGVLAVPGLLLVSRLPWPFARFRGLHAKLAGFGDQLATALRIYAQDPALLIGTTVLSAVVQGANVVVVWLVGIALGAPVPASFYWILVPLVSILTLLPVSVNGMGVREWTTVMLLAPLGVGSGTATILAFLWFITYTAVSLGGVGPYLLGGFGRLPAGDGGTEPPTPFTEGDDGPVGGDSDQGRAGQPSAAA